MTLEIRQNGMLVASGAPPAVSSTATHVVFKTGAYEIKVSKNDLTCLKPTACALTETVRAALHTARLAQGQ